MKRNTISEAIGAISEKYIVEANDMTTFNKNKTNRVFKRITAIAAAAAICFSVSVTAMAAANVEPAYNILYAISPQIAQSLKPIQLSCEDNGIKMEVISADVRDDKAYIYVAMQDMTGDRIDETVDLFDSWRINCPFDQSGTCSLISYDKGTKTGTFLIEIKTMHGEKIDGKKVTFYIGEFLSHKQEMEGVRLDLDLTKAVLNPKTQTDADGRGQDINLPMLLSEGSMLDIGKGASVTGMGFIDGQLHIQAYYEDILQTDNHGYIYLVDKNGQELYGKDGESFGTSFWDKDRKGSYEEYIFDITPEELADYQVYGYFMLSDTLTKGNWNITFKLN